MDSIQEESRQTNLKNFPPVSDAAVPASLWSDITGEFDYLAVAHVGAVDCQANESAHRSEERRVGKECRR